MKKIIIFASVIVFALSGCSSELEQTEILLEEPEIIDNEFMQEGFYIHDKYLWHDDMKFSESVYDLLGVEESTFSYGIWHTLEDSDETKLFLIGDGGCAGCSHLQDKYFVVDNEDFSISTEEFENADLSYLFNRGAAQFLTIDNSPDGTKVAYIRARITYSSPEEITQESVWIFDLLSGKEVQVAKINEDESVMDCEDKMFCSIKTDLVFWNGDELVVDESVKSDEEIDPNEISLLTERYFSSRVPSNHGASVTAFDFDGDEFKEYFAYFHKQLDEPAPFGARDRDWNGAFQLYKWIDHEWTVVYEDEGTVGYEGYGVYREMLENSYLYFVDVDDDGIEEVKISTHQDGSGSYVDYYFLKWDGEKIAKASFAETKTREELKELFLKDGETLGTSGYNYINICPEDPASTCHHKQSGPGSIGRVWKNFEYLDGVFTAVSYSRTDY